MIQLSNAAFIVRSGGLYPMPKGSGEGVASLGDIPESFGTRGAYFGNVPKLCGHVP